MAKPDKDIGDNVINEQSVKTALAIMIQDEEDLKAVQNRRKRNRKRLKAEGFELGDLDWVLKKMEEDPQEVAEQINRRLRIAAFANLRIGESLDMFAEGRDNIKVGTDWEHDGLMAGMRAADAKPPENLVGDEQQLWMRGWHAGQRLRQRAFLVTHGYTEADADKVLAEIEAGTHSQTFEQIKFDAQRKVDGEAFDKVERAADTPAADKSKGQKNKATVDSPPAGNA